MSKAPASHWRRSTRRFAREPVAMAALIYLVLVVLVAVAAPLVATHEPNFQDLQHRFSGLSGAHWLGTDNLGRDTFARLIYGARTSMLITTATALLATCLAVPIGLLSGYWSGKADVVVMRLTDAMLAIPPLVLALAIAGTLGPGTRNLIIALVLVIIPGQVRLVRGQTLAVREEGYVDASKAIGTPSIGVIVRRVFPHVLSPLLVQISIMLGTILVVEASLSFLGLGNPPPNASWGAMLQSGFELMATDARLMLVPGIAIAITTLAFNAVGDGLRNALKDGVGSKPRRGDRLGTTTVHRSVLSVGEAQGAPSTKSDVALSIRHLSVEFDTHSGPAKVLDDVSIDLRRGEILGLVGESGCGKTVTSMSILRLLPSPPARILDGEVIYEGRDLLRLPTKQLRSVRGRDIAMIFQDPMASLNPAFTVGDQIVEAQRLHQNVSRSAARARAAELLDLVGIPDARKRLADFPHTFSGGMRQRVLIAMALANNPKVLVADEPTTALDVTVQAQIIELIRDLRDEFDMSVIFVTHDLGVVQELCDRVTVMYAGQVVEQAPVRDVFAAAGHPYSAALLEALPELGDTHDRLRSIPGTVPSALAMPAGCRFQPRCEFATDDCQAPVPLLPRFDGHVVRCVHSERVTLSSRKDQEPAIEVVST